MADLANRSTLLKAFGIGMLLAALGLGGYTYFGSSGTYQTVDGSDLPAITVYKSPTCGCCSKWIDHLRENGFTVRAQNVESRAALQKKHNIPRMMGSCHTGVVDGYVVEGHVPAQDVARLLREKPDIAGLTVPGMPVGSPGMEQGERFDPYAVMAFTDDGRAAVFSRYED
jgi:hypothetical protein